MLVKIITVVGIIGEYVLFGYAGLITGLQIFFIVASAIRLIATVSEVISFRDN